MTRQLSDFLLTQIISGLDQEKFSEKAQKLPYESQVYINANISMLKEKFAEFVGRYAQPGAGSSTITEEDVKTFFKELNEQRLETLRYHLSTQKEKK